MNELTMNHFFESISKKLKLNKVLSPYKEKCRLNKNNEKILKYRNSLYELVYKI
jgi:mRNA-degrading endonuclease RelE of RelBE toxin-antitoxin system